MNETKGFINYSRHRMLYGKSDMLYDTLDGRSNTLYDMLHGSTHILYSMRDGKTNMLHDMLHGITNMLYAKSDMRYGKGDVASAMPFRLQVAGIKTEPGSAGNPGCSQSYICCKPLLPHYYYSGGRRYGPPLQ